MTFEKRLHSLFHTPIAALHTQRERERIANMDTTTMTGRRGLGAERAMTGNAQTSTQSSPVWWCHSCDAQKVTVADESSSCGEMVCSDCGSCFIEQIEVAGASRASGGGSSGGGVATSTNNTRDTEHRTGALTQSSSSIPATQESSNAGSENIGEYASNIILEFSIQERDGSNSATGIPDTRRTEYASQNVQQASASSLHTVDNTSTHSPLLIHTSNTNATNTTNGEQQRQQTNTVNDETEQRVRSILEGLSEDELDELDVNRVNTNLHQSLMQNIGGWGTDYLANNGINMWSTMGGMPMPMPMPFLRGHGMLGSGHTNNGSFVIHGQNQADGGHEFSTLEELIQHISFLENSNRNANRPAAAAIVDSLEKQIIPCRSSEDDNVPKYECCICMCDMDEGEEATRMPCGHLFHFDCIKQWLATNNTCPVCREKLATDADLDNNDDPSFH